MSNKRFLRSIPTKRAYSELNHGEFLRRIFDLQVPDVGAVEFQRLPPRCARDAGHLEVDGDEVSRSDMAAEVFESRLEVRFRHSLYGNGGV